LCELLYEAGANIIITDVVDERVQRVVNEFKATAVDKDAIYGVDADIYAPCALGATINDDTIPQLKCKIVCGGANNQLKIPLTHGKALQARGIIYAPDYLANAGGVINVSYEHAEGGYNEEAARRDIDRIYNRMREILRISDETGELAFQTADKMAEARIEAMRNVRSILTPGR